MDSTSPLKGPPFQDSSGNSLSLSSSHLKTLQRFNRYSDRFEPASEADLFSATDSDLPAVPSSIQLGEHTTNLIPDETSPRGDGPNYQHTGEPGIAACFCLHSCQSEQVKGNFMRVHCGSIYRDLYLKSLTPLLEMKPPGAAGGFGRSSYYSAGFSSKLCFFVLCVRATSSFSRWECSNARCQPCCM